MVDIERRGVSDPPSDAHELRSVAQLNMLHSLAPRLNQLTAVKDIADAITVELRTIIDYHNCRVYLLADDGVTLEPIAFRGELTEYEGETYEELVTKVGEGITGHVAETKESFYTPDADKVDFSVQIEGTGDVLESMLAVPMLHGDRVVGVIVLSNLGYDQFHPDDMRLLEVLASHAAVALENARLFQREREAAETSGALLALSQQLTGAHGLDEVLSRTVQVSRSIVAVAAVAAFSRDPQTGAFDLVAQHGLSAEQVPPIPSIDAETARRFLQSLEEPFVLSGETLALVPDGYRVVDGLREALVAPLRWEPDGFGGLLFMPAPDTSLTEREIRLAGGVADITSLALGSASRVHELERFHELVESIEATFWEAEPASLRFTFLSSRATQMLTQRAGDAAGPTRWGDQVHEEDRTRALEAVREAIERGDDRSVEYRASGAGESRWLRDLVHVVHDPQGRPISLRGLMVDITERKRAEEALRRSERKYSEAFRREREATQRLRALDDMKNTFLEAVSHDLRTPLTSILGSALTLEHAGQALPSEDSMDLVHRIAANARKLERLLSDLLDLDRLQRGIIAPQRRPTDIAELVRETIDGSDLLHGRSVELDVTSLVISVDAAKVERIVENLVANAARHTPAGSRLWVRVRPEDHGALIVVEDEGPGVPDELREAIFEPFRQAPHNGASHSPGVGVGLSLVARFAELHGGRAWVEARPEGGASFRVYLPGG